MNQSIKNPVLLAIRDNPGLATKLGKICGVGRSAVWMWRQVPSRHVLAVAKFMNLSPSDVRSDLYPPELNPDLVYSFYPDDLVIYMPGSRASYILAHVDIGRTLIDFLNAVARCTSIRRAS
jgi:hypothetical protein